jgi:predicted lipoprotein with Yx(FWY)xxD motif
MANRYLFSLLAAGLLTLGSTGTTVVGAQHSPTAAAAALVKSAPAQILETSTGMTLYIFSKDKAGMSMCSGKCAAYWPAYTVPVGSKVTATIAGVTGTFGSLKASGGAQLTFDKSPLYTFAGDKKAGTTNGQGVGGVWWTVVANSGMAMGAIPASSPVKLASAHLLVTAKGMAVYVFIGDQPGKSACAGACAKFWPPVLVPAGSKPPAKVAGIKGTFGTSMRADGGTQLTLDGAPLYTFSLDKKPGDLKGQGVGSKWWAIAA